MTTKTVRVGDVVAWDEVPLNTMVRWYWDGHGSEHHVKNLSATGRMKTACVGSAPPEEWRTADRDSGQFDPTEPVTVIALNLTGNESADELRALAEEFDRKRNEAVLMAHAVMGYCLELVSTSKG